jgi:hypothetical protein
LRKEVGEDVERKVSGNCQTTVEKGGIINGMSKRKRLWIIPVIVAVIIGVTGVFALSGSLPKGDQGGVALASGSEQAPQGEHYFWRMTRQQVEMWNQLVEQNPEFSEGELLNQVAPEVVQDMNSNLVEGLLECAPHRWNPENPPCMFTAALANYL